MSTSPAGSPHVPPSKQPRSFPSTEQIREMLKNNQCYARFRESGASDVWKLFEEVCYKSNNEFTGIIRCTKCNHMARYHGHITGTSHMRRHRCFGELFPDAVKHLQSAKKDGSNTTPRTPKIPKNQMINKTPEKRSICLENGGDSKKVDEDGMEVENETGENEKGVKIELRTYNNQTIITPKVRNPMANTILAFCYSELVNLECVCSNSFKAVLKGAAVKVSTPLLLNLPYLRARANELYVNEKASIVAALNESIERNIGGAIVSDFKDDLCIMSFSYIDSDWRLQDRTLRGATRIDDILTFISQTLGDYGLLKDTLINKFIYISNAGALSGVKVHLSSVSHLLDNLVDQAVFQDGKHDQLVENCKYICSELKILPEVAISPWIYRYDVINAVLENLDKFSPGNFSMDTMLPSMTMIKNLLAPFREASVLMRTDVQEVPTINQVALQYFKLHKELQLKEDDSEELTDQKKKLQVSLESNFELHMMHKVAVFLWPNFRHLKMFTESEREEIYAEVRQMLEEKCSEAAAPLEENLDDSIKAQTQYSEWEAVTEFDQDEVTRYLLDKFNHCNEKTLLTWWKEASKRYPKLSQVARSILSIPATVTSIERRQRLHSRPPVDEELMFLHCNMATR
uniref:Zinc finger protein 618 n=1 Tax=Aceria tosichella TaxID=561515 RepID=A0A6G1SA49_9ACAR